MCDCEQLRKALESLAEGQNLVALRSAYCKTQTIADDATSGRITGTLTRGPHTKAWALRLIALPTATGGDDAHALFRVNAQGEAAPIFTGLLALAGDHLQPGAKHVQVFPAWLDRWTVDVAGVDADLATQADVTITVEVVELVAADRPDCGR